MSAHIQMALAKAAASGRAQIVQLLHRFMPYLVLLGAMNIGLVAVLTLRRRVA
jgi:hypothetical protein